jgi:hypothetical protein
MIINLCSKYGQESQILQQCTICKEVIDPNVFFDHIQQFENIKII